MRSVRRVALENCKLRAAGIARRRAALVGTAVTPFVHPWLRIEVWAHRGTKSAPNSDIQNAPVVVPQQCVVKGVTVRPSAHGNATP